MADLTQEIAVASDWVNLTAAAGLTEGASYVLDVEGRYSTQPLVRWAETDDATAPAVTGHPWIAGSYQGILETRTYAATQANLWLRCINESVTVTVTEYK